MRTENKFCWLKIFLLLLRVVINFNIYIYIKHCTWRQQTEKANIYVLYAETRWAGDRAGLLDSHWLTDFFISTQQMEFETWLEMCPARLYYYLSIPYRVCLHYPIRVVKKVTSGLEASPKGPPISYLAALNVPGDLQAHFPA
jgi:hypothetical protein